MPKCGHMALRVFEEAAASVPAYRQILVEKGVDAEAIGDLETFAEKAPVIDKSMTFGRYPVAQLCREGRMGDVAGVLTSSGHSGLFAFGIHDRQSAAVEADRVDDGLDLFFGVRSRSTLLINCLPMGVKVPTRACTLAETCVRPDMVTALVEAFAGHFDQIVMVGETAFIKHVVERGKDRSIDWHALRVHVAVGEEMLAENARRYIEQMLGIDRSHPEDGVMVSSMGVAELGLNLFFETPRLIELRGALARDVQLRLLVTGGSDRPLPMVFTYDPQRIFVEVLPEDQLVITTLDAERRIPLVRYRTGDKAAFIDDVSMDMLARRVGGSASDIRDQPLVLIYGRGEHVTSAGLRIYPEEVKEALYDDPGLARLTTANFGLASGEKEASLRIQLAEGVEPDSTLEERFADRVRRYVAAPIGVRIQSYGDFGSDVAVDYERKFNYI